MNFTVNFSNVRYISVYYHTKTKAGRQVWVGFTSLKHHNFIVVTSIDKNNCFNYKNFDVTDIEKWSPKIGQLA